MGIKFGSSGSKTAAGEVKVWGPQADFLKYGFGQAKDIYGAAKGSAAYGGDTYAAIDPSRISSVVNNGVGMANRMFGAAGDLTGSGQSQLALANGGYGNLVADMNDPNGANNAGASLANSKYADDLIGAANNDIYRGLNENDLPANRLNAIGSGNSGSTRAMMNDAILTRGAQDRASANAANIRSSFFDRGVQAFNNNLTNRANLLSTLFNQGMGAYLQAASAGTNAENFYKDAFGYDQANSQGLLNQAQDAWNRNDTRASDLLGRYWALVGNNFGQSTSGASKSKSNEFGFNLFGAG